MGFSRQVETKRMENNQPETIFSPSAGLYTQRQILIVYKTESKKHCESVNLSKWLSISYEDMRGLLKGQ